MKKLIIGLFLFISFFIFAPITRAEGILFQDSFDTNSLSNWKSVRNEQWQNPDKPCVNQEKNAEWQVKNGHLEITVDGPNCTFSLVPRFLDLTNVQNYQLDFDLTLSETRYADRSVLFAWQNNQNWYDLSLFDQTVAMHKSAQNQFETIENSFRFPMYPGETYHFTIQVLATHEIVLKINNIPSFIYPDNPHTFYGFRTIGLQASVSTASRSVSVFDNVVVRSLDPGIQLNVPLLKQFDTKWGNLEYDSASMWDSRTTITNWGCSLTSMVMVLRYYGMAFLPDGSYLTPGTLNNWLKSQRDGYLGEGSLNWLAVTRLTKLIHDRFGTPKLEYKRERGDLEIAKKEVRQQRPVIIRLDGHFLVGDGVTTDEQDILIKDPAYKFTKFSQHKALALNINTFTPSFTDLSYFLLAHKPGIQVKLIDSSGNEVEEFSESRENIRLFDEQQEQFGDQSSADLVEHLYAKPPQGTYVLEVTASQPTQETLQLLSYDQAGEATDLSQTGMFTPEPKYFILNYKAGSTAQITPVTTFATFLTDLRAGNALNQIQSNSTFTSLSDIAEAADQAGNSRQSRYLLQLQGLVAKYSADIAYDLYLILQNDLLAISAQLNDIIPR